MVALGQGQGLELMAALGQGQGLELNQGLEQALELMVALGLGLELMAALLRLATPPLSPMFVEGAKTETRATSHRRGAVRAGPLRPCC